MGSPRRVVVQLEGEQTETIPVDDEYELPILDASAAFVQVLAADGSEVAFRTPLVRVMHLKPAVD